MTGGAAIAMTDVIISATAALLIGLALAANERPQPMPVQADLRIFCEGDAVMVGDGTRAIPVTAATLGTAPPAFELPPRLFYSLALVPGPEGLGTECLSRVQRDVVRGWNDGLTARPGAVFSVQPALP
ncbi:MAG: hypothetical protein ACU0DW_09075 [Shimia sp.]